MCAQEADQEGKRDCKTNPIPMSNLDVHMLEQRRLRGDMIVTLGHLKGCHRVDETSLFFVTLECRIQITRKGY